jgi:lysophospholipase L1-like esterase
MQTSAFILKPNDRIVFYGDSITEQHLYTNYVESYLSTRFPELKLSFFNAGWGGDTAPGGAKRLQRDVLNLKPTVVTLCFGMNDGRYCPPTDEIRTTFVAGLREIVARLKAANVRVVLLTPGMADGVANPGLGAVDYNRRGLRILADEVVKLAREEGLPCADLNRLMTDVDVRGKAADPTFCMMPDGFHPEPSGHLVMAFGVLQALGVPTRQQSVTVDCASGEASASEGITVRRPRRHEVGFRLDLKLDRLPFFVEPAARKVLPFLPFQETFNALTLVVRSLPSASASLRAQGPSRPEFLRAQLEAGINLFDQWMLSPVRNAEAIHRYTAEKDQIYFRLWRGLALNGENSTYYNSKLHSAVIRLGPGMERGREHLLAKAALSCALHIVATDKPSEVLLDGDFVSQWSLRGAYPRPYDQDRLGGEAAFSAKAPALGPDWVSADPAWPASQMMLKAFGQQSECFAYAVTLVESPVAQRAELLIGSDDGAAAWLNGEAIHSNLDARRGLAPDQDRVPVRLKAGPNVLLLKITQGDGDWGLCARFAGLRRPLNERRPPQNA